MSHPSVPVKFKVSDTVGEVNGVLVLPESTEYILLFAHGAGAGMNHPFMENMAEYLADVNIGTFRFNFPYMENHSKRPDPPLVLIKTIQSAPENGFRPAERRVQA
jgi:hypothetical protein